MFNKKNRVIKYEVTADAYDGLLPAKSVIPDWYKKTPKFSKEHNPNRIPYKTSVKGCSPFLDALSTGYVLTTPCDLGVDNAGIDTLVTWNEHLKFIPVDVRNGVSAEMNKEIPIPNGFSSQHFVWATRVMFEVPKGYSALVTHPLNRHDLPFVTLSGVLDGEFLMHTGNVPVFFSKTFNGIIPKGTPFAQVLPFKRENWDSLKDPALLQLNEKHQAMTRGTVHGWYKNTFWRKKTYN